MSLKIVFKRGTNAPTMTQQLLAHPLFIAAIEEDRLIGKRRTAEDLFSLIVEDSGCSLTTVRQARLNLEKLLDKGQRPTLPESPSEAPKQAKQKPGGKTSKAQSEQDVIPANGYAAPDTKASPASNAAPIGATGEEFKITDMGATGEVYSQSFSIQTVDQLMDSGKVDLSIWEPYNPELKAWDAYCKDNDGHIVTRTLYSVRAKLRRCKEISYAKAVIEGLIEDLREQAPVYPHITYHKICEPHLLEIQIPDPHIDKLCWGKETGEDYDLTIAKRRFMESVERLATYASTFEVDRILLPLGNDFFNTDSQRNETTNGTRQDVDSRWQKSFVEGHLLARDAIDYLSAIAPVDVLVVSGNHDAEKSFFMGEVLSAYYSRCSQVNVDNGPTSRKYYQYGENLIGLTHGNEEKHDKLPMLMAVEVPDKWASSRFREWHTGHLHHLRQKLYQPVAEDNGVVVRVFRSLSPPDAWHKKRGFESMRSAEAIVWHPNNGPVAQFCHTPRV